MAANITILAHCDAVWGGRQPRHLALQEEDKTQEQSGTRNPVNTAINRTGGQLAETLVQFLSDRKPKVKDAFPEDLRDRFDNIISSLGYNAKLARIRLSFDCSFLYAIDPDWTVENLIPYFDWRNSEALDIHKAYHFAARIGPADFFQHIKKFILEAFNRHDWSGSQRHTLSEHLVLVVMSKYQGNDPCDISAIEAQRALRVGESEIRHAASRFLWRMIDDETKGGRADFWRKIMQPTFLDLWPRDKHCQDGKSAYHLADMALCAEQAFPDAMEVILPFLEPITAHDKERFLYDLESEHQETLKEHSDECLDLIDILIKDIEFIESKRLKNILDIIKDSKNELENDYRYRRLASLANKF